MKYQIHNIIVPQEKRKEINNKCLYVIDNNLNVLTPEIIFNSYTGDGGLHGLKYNDYDNFHSYTKAKQEIEQGQFFTPHFICKFIVDCIKPSNNDLIADLCSGMGNFANYLPVEENVYLNEIDIKAVKVAKYLYPKANITSDDIRSYNPDVKFDIVLGNPPFSLCWQVGRDEYLSQLYYCIKSSQLLKPSGIMALIVPNSFLNDEFADGGMIKEVNNHFNFICQFDIPANSFKNVGLLALKLKLMIFQKKSEHLQNKEYTTNKITVNDISEQQANIIYNAYVKPVQEQKEKIKNKLFFENLHNSENEENKEFAFKVKKLLYDIKRNPKTNKGYGKCYEYVNKYYTQKMPEGMKFEEWEKVRITKNKVLGYLKRTLLKQNQVEQDVIKLVKTNYSLKLKAYSRKTQLQLNKLECPKQFSLNDMVLQEVYPFDDKTYYKLFKSKLKAFKKQTEPYNNMKLDKNIQLFLDNLEINDTLNDKIIRLNNIQKEDTNKVLQKQYGFLQWERGCGKTITGTAQALYRLENNNIHNVIVIAPSIAIKGTWIECMESYGYNHRIINNLADLNSIQKGEIVLITLYVVSKYKKQIKKMLKVNNKKYFLVFDESDAITNLSSKTYKSVLDCFRRLVKYKLLLTGTSTRNNINEFFGQLELLYNNSINMLSKVSCIYETNKKDNELEVISNPIWNKPFPAYKQGFGYFKKSFSPEKITVFGINKYNQDIYNSEELKELLSYTVITRTFEEVTGRKGYQIQQKLCNMNQAEKEVYSVIIEKFYEIERDYFSSTGNARKDAGLRALHQIDLLLKACAAFHNIKGYNDNNVSSKFKCVFRDLERLSNKRVAIGCTSKSVVYEYERRIKERFPNRKVIAFTGEDLNIYQRKAIIKQIKEDTNTILITTQQSLSCSLNIGFIDHIFITQLQWNDSKMGQYYFRFIRYDSLKDKNVYIYTYANSIESNLMKLIITKEKINLFMKDQELSETEINERYGIDFDIINMLLSKEKDSEGKSFIRWGEQQIV